MASTEKESMKRLRSLSECCICLMTYTDPRMLPCFHSACLKCFEDIQMKNKKKTGDVLPCPLCRNEFPIPPDGMKGLQRNFFIESLVQVTSVFNAETNSRPCTMCSMIEEVKDVTEATMRCLNCCENYCLRCSKMHKTLKGTKDHKIVELNNDVNEEEIRNIFPIRKCSRHPDKVLDYYCSDCKTVVCVSCFVENHKFHECKDVTTVDMEFRQRIEQSFTEINDRKEEMLLKKIKLETEKGDFLAKVFETESVIRKKNQQLKDFIDLHTKDLLDELSLLKQHQEKKINSEIEEIERKLTVLESFVTFCTELTSKGSPSEVCGSADSLITGANELSKEYDEYVKAPSKSFDFEFIATDHNTLQNSGNIIGKLSESTEEFNEFDVVIANSEDAIRMSLNRPEDVTALDPLPHKFQIGTVAAAAVYRDSIFVSGLGSDYKEIWRLDATSSKWSKCASLIQGRQGHSVAFVDHVLYICGGLGDSAGQFLDDVETYNIFDSKCSKVGKLTYAVCSAGNCVLHKASLYIFGGYGAHGYNIINRQAKSHVQVFDTRLNTCTLLTNQMPRASAWLRSGLWENSVILLGKDGCFMYDIDRQAWKVRERFKLENVYSGVIVNDGKLFVIGCGAKKDEVRWIPIANILSDELIEWRHYAKLPKNFCDKVFVVGQLDYT